MSPDSPHGPHGPHGLRLRPARFDDADRLLAWRNERSTRAASLTQDVIEPAAHRSWLERRLADETCRLLIVELDGTPVGQVRLDRSGGDAEVSIGLAEHVRGRGVGAEALRLVRGALPWPEVIRLLAHVREENAASLRLFAGLGYDELGRDDGVVALARPV
ncbi:GNAT family N-acetyltransferase [Nocardioides lianchengensis]|uniref:Protein N-acetyltransferase, RimJ/RimL family n=1 Tax=Nocardioides lianchengensis TaxID=1045774 RepID=A0A1G6I182_9ACTN|nr:GNAT family N-acetyltransferase [Nocardioides lianchengensis]NYG13205.1 RimJ/RimL family protein N-acetyltransferase [Nocardioides lianchengensis]SDC00292.1 Protein N-acetyltransferase, RimJ/RimL family [Nocardioides lianchengensis]